MPLQFRRVHVQDAGIPDGCVEHLNAFKARKGGILDPNVAGLPRRAWAERALEVFQVQ